MYKKVPMETEVTLCHSFQDHWKVTAIVSSSFFHYHFIFCILFIQYIKMASGGSTTHMEAPQFSFNAPDLTQERKNFYTRALDFLETCNIDPERQDENKHGWKQIKMMFQGEDR